MCVIFLLLVIDFIICCIAQCSYYVNCFAGAWQCHCRVPHSIPIISWNFCHQREVSLLMF